MRLLVASSATNGRRWAMRCLVQSSISEPGAVRILSLSVKDWG